ncbi:MAG TPA: lycopene cyclase family protein [Rubrobacter sp.]|nr:lycopene cyclase family protein [Rubrobacter sp.]
MSEKYPASVRRSGPVELPERLGPDGSDPGRYAYVILGAGCAGLSLCYCLLERGVRGRILILDRKERFEDDRTWCFWDVEPTPFSHLAVKSWTSWSVHAEGRNVVHTTDRYPYLCLPATEFYRHALARIAAHDNVTVRLGEAVEGYKDLSDGVLVRTSEGVYPADKVFDGRGLPPGSPAFEKARANSRWVSQEFLGLRLRTGRRVFDPSVCTLMDFSVSQGRGLRFVYVLPFGDREALVENVYLSGARVSPEEHRAEISGYLDERYGLSTGDYAVDGEERGHIPMTDYPFPRRLGERVYSVGMLGGETRPSTGYTFLRIQRYCRALAESLAGYDAVAEKVHPRRYDLLDGLFLRFVRDRPEDCPGVYARMFAGVPPDPLVRFLTEKSTPRDEARLVAALPKGPFLRLAGRGILERLRDVV